MDIQRRGRILDLVVLIYLAIYLKICLSYAFDALSWMLHAVGPICLCIRNDLLTCCTFLYFFSYI